MSEMNARSYIRQNGMLISMLVIFGVMAVITRFWTGGWTFVSPENLSNLSQQVTQTGILAIGMTMVILIGGIDLSVGSVLAVSAIILAQSSEWFLSAGPVAPYLAILCCLVAGIALGAWNGAMISRFNLLPFVVTLATLTMARGIAYLISGSQSIRVKADIFKYIGVYSVDRFYYEVTGSPLAAGDQYFPVISIVLLAVVFAVWLVIQLRAAKRNAEQGYTPEHSGGLGMRISAVAAGCAVIGAIFASHHGIPVMVLIFAVLAYIASFVLNHTVFGRHLYAVGGNREAARLSGVDVQRCTFYVFVIMGFLCAVSGIVSTSRAQSATPATQGVLAELEAIAAVVVGGTSLMGGVGAIGGTVIGVLIIGVVVNAMILMALPNTVQLIFKGLLIMIAVILDIKTKQK